MNTAFWNRSALFLGLTILTLSAFSQGKDLGANAPSPNAASLGVYGEIPVSKFTGLPNISIPLYEVRGNKINLPISLNYHADGLRPEVHPSWVGNGWSLSAGGIITRKVNGTSDEFTRMGQGIGKPGYYYNYSNLAAPDWNSQAKMTGPMGTYQQVQKVGNSSLFDADTEPDEFDFTFLGYNGKFFLDQYGRWLVQCDKSLKVVFNSADMVMPFTTTLSGGYDANNISPAFGKFTIIDELGNQYIFGSTDTKNTAIEFSDVMVPTPVDHFGNTILANAWYLTKIVSADGTEVIDLAYERGPLTSQIGFSSTYGGFKADAVNTGFNWHIPSNYSPGCTDNVNNQGLSGWIVFPVYLVSISMPSQSLFIDFSGKSKSNELRYIDDLTSNDAYLKVYTATPSSPAYNQSPPFNASPPFPSAYIQDISSQNVVPYYINNPADAQNSVLAKRLIWLKLDAIAIKNSSGAVIKTVNFAYNESSTKRLQLALVSIGNASGQSVQKYGFSYNSTALPDYLTTYTDHWGFNNNNPLPSNLAASGGNSDFYQLRAPDATGVQTQAEILTSITYPTGGKSTFTYEPNKYSSVVYRNAGDVYINGKGTTPTVESGIGGGLRIKQIEASDGYGNITTKTYYYVNGFHANTDPSTLTSSGVLDTKPVYSFKNQGWVDQDGGAQAVYQINSSNPVTPTSSNSSAALIGYTKVIEQNSDRGYSQYEFTNHDNGYNDQMPFNYTLSMSMTRFPASSLWFERGAMLHQTDYAVSSSNVETLVSEKTMTYTTSVTSQGLPTAANAIYNNVIIICGGAPSQTRGSYQMLSYPFVPSGMTTKTYSTDGSGNSVTESEIYNWDQYRNMSRLTKTNSKGQTEITATRYPYDLASSDARNPYSAMVGLNKISVPIEKWTSVGGKNTKGELHTYKYYSAQVCLNDENYEFNIPADVSSSASQITQSSFDPYVGKLRFDSKYNLVSRVYYDASNNISTIEGRGGTPTSLLWNYNKMYPVAKVQNAYNIRQSGTTGNIPVQASFSAVLNGIAPFSPNYFTLKVTQTGNATITFRYNNQYISGNNSTTMNYTLKGASPSTYTNSGTLCAVTNSTPNPCTNKSVTFFNLTPGTYTLTATIQTQTGFSNYYNYNLDVDFPSAKYGTVDAKTSLAYTSFEGSSQDYGNFTGINTTFVRSGGGITGNYYYYLTSGSPLTYTGMVSGTTYIVSYWANAGAVTVNGSAPGLSGKTRSGYTYYEHTVVNPTTITIATSGSANIDEVRVYPVNAQMTTYSYAPMLGVTSQCDINGTLLYYEYDSLGRLILIRDEDKNIVKKFCYSYNGTSISCN